MMETEARALWSLNFLCIMCWGPNHTLCLTSGSGLGFSKPDTRVGYDEPSWHQAHLRVYGNTASSVSPAGVSVGTSSLALQGKETTGVGAGTTLA